VDAVLGFLSNPSSILPDFGDEKPDEEGTKKRLPPKGFKQYTLDIITADKLGAGTDANVYAVIIGSKGQTSKITFPEDKSNSRFEQGCTDSFTVEVEGDVGDILELVLGHDNKGGGSDWNLSEARLADIASQNVYTFHCDTVLGGLGRKCEGTFKPDKHD